MWISFADQTASFFVTVSEPPVDQNYDQAIDWLVSQGILDRDHVLSLIVFPVGDAVPETVGMTP